MHKNKVTEKLVREEWDFSQVPQEELEACMYYEYFRESKTFRRIFKDFKKKWQHFKNKYPKEFLKFNVDQISLTQAHPNRDILGAVFAVYTYAGYNEPSEFITQTNGRIGVISPLLVYLVESHAPDCPWQKLPSELRGKLKGFKNYLSRYKEYPKHRASPPILLSFREPFLSTEDWRQKLIKNEYPRISFERPLVGHILVNLIYDEEKIIDFFRKKLHEAVKSANISLPQKEDAKGYRKHAPRDTLKQLSVLRLRYYCSTFKVANKMLFTMDKHYTDRQAANRAYKSALNFFRDIFAFKKNEKPIHYTPKWRG